MWGSGNLTLFLEAVEPGTATSSLPLTAFGTTASGWFGGISLQLACDDDANLLARPLPFHLEAGLSDYGVRNLNLWTAGENLHRDASVDLFVKNSQSGVTLGISLFVAGSGTGAGAMPTERGLGLFLARRPAGGIPIFLAGPGGPLASGIPLFSRGAGVLTSSAPLSVALVVGAADSGVGLYVNGF